jgi:hypothetical protein
VLPRALSQPSLYPCLKAGEYPERLTGAGRCARGCDADGSGRDGGIDAEGGCVAQAAQNAIATGANRLAIRMLMALSRDDTPDRAGQNRARLPPGNA